MRIEGAGILSAAEPGGSRAVATFPAVTSLDEGSLLASYSIGSGKDADDLDLELRRTRDGGRTWSEPVRPFKTSFGGRRGSLKAGPITSLGGPHLIIAALWIDREAFPGEPLFNPATEGCLPMAILVADSADSGATWSPWREVPMPDDIGPPSLTTALLRLPSGRLALSVESNKPYLDRSKWLQRVAYAWSSDAGRTWTEPRTVCADPTGRIANWDQRTGVTRDGDLLAFTWTYDFEAVAYRNITRRISRDEGMTWSEPEDLGFADQASHPAIMPDGRVVLAWVDRFASHSIRARLSERPDAPFEPETEVTIYQHPAIGGTLRQTTGDMLADMGLWTFGLPYAEALPDGGVLVVYYAGHEGSMAIHWARLALDRSA
jgi:hypothetical protein